MIHLDLFSGIGGFALAVDAVWPDAELDGLKLSKSWHRVERLKALGNSIVPAVAIEIMRAIKGGHHEHRK